MRLKNIIKADCLVATLGLFFTFWLFIVVSPFSFDFLSPLENMFEDFDYTDIVFSQMNKYDKIDERIIVVNIGNLPKSDIAKQIENINKYKPKVIGLDVFPLIPNPNNLRGDSMFADVAANANNFVLAAKLDDWDEEKNLWGKFEKSPPQFSYYAANAYVNLFIEDYETVREFTSIQRTANGEVYSFPATIAKYYDKSAFDYLIKRDNELETINYLGNTSAFMIIDAYQALEDDSLALSNVEDKIVLMGYLGDDLNSYSNLDRYYTPLNPRYVGKADRDMHGVLIHANAISTILSGNYIHSTPKWFENLLTFLLCYFNMLFYSKVYKTKQELFEIASIVGILIQTFLIILIMYSLFINFQTTINLSLGIAVVAFSPNTLEIYYNIIQPIVRKVAKFFKSRFSSTIQTK